MSRSTNELERAVRERYSDAAGARVDALCCPVEYDDRYLKVIPQEIIQRDYGCGDPSRYLHEGETVLDLGSGGGKICYIAAQVVGPQGRVIGVDMNDEMLALAERHRATIGERLGYRNVSFHKGRIQDLALDHGKLEEHLERYPVGTPAELEALEVWKRRQRSDSPMIPSDSIDVVISNCVLNLVRPEDKPELFREMFRVLRQGGRVAISDVVSDEEVPEGLQRDSELWSGCIAGAYREDRFLEAFHDAGFHGMRILERSTRPWRAVQGIEFRSVTVEAFKGQQGPCLERAQAVIYRGPWRSVTDDDGHTLYRGQPMAVCDKTFQTFGQPPYSHDIVLVPPRDEVPVDRAPVFDCNRDKTRSPRETKGLPYRKTTEAEDGCCGSGGGRD